MSDSQIERAEEKPWSGLGVFSAFIAVVAGFLAATTYTQHYASAITSSARSISENTAPAVELLSEARSELHVQLMALLYPEDSDQREPMAEAHVAFVLGSYFALPAKAGEGAIRTDIAGGFEEFRTAAKALRLARQQGTATGQQLRDVRAAAERARDALGRGLKLNAEAAHTAAAQIELIRTQSMSLALALSALCVALALLAAFLAISGVRRHAALLQAHSRIQKIRAEELEMFASRVAHDVLSPLQPVALGLATLERRFSDDKGAIDVVHRVSRSLARVKELVAGLLDFARSAARPDPSAHTSVGSVARGLYEEIQPFAKEEHAHLEFGPIPSCEVACAPGVLASVLQNLVRNALKYMGDCATRRISLRVSLDQGVAHFEVQDTGPGIPREAQRNLFEPYVRASSTGKPGLGLGLATVKRLVEAHGGRVGLVSSPGAGTTFWFELPATKGAPDDALPFLSGRGWYQEVTVVP